MSGHFLVLLVAVLLVGCRHTHAIDSADERDQDRINRVAQDRKATLVLRDGSSLALRNARVASDSLFWLNVQTERTEASALTHVEELIFRRRGRGAVDGAGLAFLVGVPLGALLIDSPDGGAGGARERVSAALAGGASFGLWGLVIGGAVGSRITYRFGAQEQPESDLP